MSVDNGIYILKTKKGKGFEYRVAHLQGIDNVHWNPKKKDHDPDYVYKPVLKTFFGKCKVYTKEEDAANEAGRIYKSYMDESEMPIIEDGICMLDFDIEFPK